MDEHEVRGRARSGAGDRARGALGDAPFDEVVQRHRHELHVHCYRRMVATRANGRPATANYLRRPGDDLFRALSVDLLRLDDEGRIAEINCFLDASVFRAFGLAATRQDV